MPSSLKVQVMGPFGGVEDAASIEIESARDTWPKLRAIAERHRSERGKKIRVLDRDGGIVVLTSVSAMLMVDVGLA